MPSWLTSIVPGLIGWLQALLDSNFITACAGAFAGAFAAQRIAERAKQQDNLIQEIRNTNAALMLAFGICNTFLSLKKQHVKELKENYDRQLEAFRQFDQRRLAGLIPPGNVYLLQADFYSLSPIDPPTKAFQALIFEKISVTGRPLALASILVQTIISLNHSIQQRNSLIEDYKKRGKIPSDVMIPLYFGLPAKDGNIDESYPSFVTSIYKQTDDCIYFSKLLSEDLVTHGKRFKAVYDKKFRSKAPEIHEPLWLKAETGGLMPSSAEYIDWESMFIAKPKSAPRWRTLVKLLCKLFRTV